MNAFDSELSAELDALRRADLWRRLPPGRRLPPERDFRSNDYLGLSDDPEITRALAAGAFEGGGRAARLLGGGSHAQDALEHEVADWLGCEGTLLFPSGYQANVGVLAALTGSGDALVLDQRIHASWIDGARLSKARRLVHRHLDLEDLAEKLREARGARRILVVTESVFSMSGEGPPLEEMEALCAEHDAWMVVDEAHAAGILGPQGCGLASSGPDSRVVARVITGGKALGIAGALVAGSRPLVDLLANRARSFVFTTATLPSVAVGLRAAIRRVRRDPTLRERPVRFARRLAGALGMQPPRGAIIYHRIGDEGATLESARALEDAGFAVGAIRPPTVPAGEAGLRIVLRASHDEERIDALAETLRDLPAARPMTSPPIASTKRPEPLFVVGTDTGVGKTVVSALLLHAIRRNGEVAYWKPVQTGDDDDTQTVRELCGGAEECGEPRFRYALPASPHEAAAAEGDAIRVEALDAVLKDRLAGLPRAARLVVELAGGLRVPLTETVDQSDWIARHARSVVLVARSGLGTLNHTQLSVEALRARGLGVAALILVGPRHDSNRETLRKRRVAEEIFELEPCDPLEARALATWPGLLALAERLRHE